MTVNDPIYGQINITEPALLELIASPAMQRLKGIGQEFPLKTAPGTNYSRFEHSIGVCYVIKYFGCDLEEQIAGLLHDVSHTAFSHTIDLVFGNEKKGDFHEKNIKRVVLNSNIPLILKKYGYKIERIIEPKNFSVLEQDLPALCADRIDYSFRTFYHRKMCSAAKITEFLNSLALFENKIVFKQKNKALKFAQTYLRTEQTIWDGNPSLAAREVPFAKVLGSALESGQITLDDLFALSDEKLLGKLQPNQKRTIENIANLRYKIVGRGDDYDYHFIGKIRYVDPPVRVSGGKTKKLSELNPRYKVELAAALKKRKRGNYVKILNKDILNFDGSAKGI